MKSIQLDYRKQDFGIEESRFNYYGAQAQNK